MPAKNRRRRIRKTRRNINIKYLVKKLYLLTAAIIFVIFLALVSFFYFKITRTTRLGKPINTIIVYEDRVSVIKYDPLALDILELTIPGTLLLDTAGGYGDYQIKNIYKLSENEKSGDELFKRTVMKNFSIPVHTVINCSNRIYDQRKSSQNLLGCINKNNIGNIIFVLYSKRVSGGNITERELSDYRVISENSVSNGEYLLIEDPFLKMEFDFSQDMEIDEVVGVEIGVSENIDIPEYINNVIKLMGGRVVGSLPAKTLNKDVKCIVTGGDRSFIRNVGSVFGCTVDYQKGAKGVKLYLTDLYLSSF